jgi:hypothetical protein
MLLPSLKSGSAIAGFQLSHAGLPWDEGDCAHKQRAALAARPKDAPLDLTDTAH